MEILFMILKSINNQKKKNISILLQLTIGFLIMFLVLGNSEYSNQVLKKSRQILKPDLYSVSWSPKGFAQNDNNLTASSFTLNSEIRSDLFRPDDFLPKTLKLLKTDKRIKSIGLQYNTVLTKKALDNANKVSIKTNTNNLVVLCHDDVSNSFFNYQVTSGQNFSNYNNPEDKKENIIPILIGPPLAKKNPIGSLIEIPQCADTKTSKPYKFRVIGVLNPLYPSLSDFDSGSSLENGGNVVIIPKLVIYDDFSKSGYNKMALELYNKTDKNKIEADINKKVSTFNIRISDISAHFESIKSQNTNLNTASLVYSIVVLILSSFGIISISLASLVKRKKEIGIRFAIGAKKSHILKLLSGEYIILFIASGAISLLITWIISNFAKVGENKLLYIDFHIVSITTLTIITFTIISIMPLIYQIIKMNPIEFINEK